MIVFIAERDLRVAAAICRRLRRLGVFGVVASDFVNAVAMLRLGPPPAVLYVGELVGELHGGDLLAEIDRIPSLRCSCCNAVSSVASS